MHVLYCTVLYILYEVKNTINWKCLREQEVNLILRLSQKNKAYNILHKKIDLSIRFYPPVYSALNNCPSPPFMCKPKCWLIINKHFFKFYIFFFC